jgi:hypothetical protein
MRLVHYEAAQEALMADVDSSMNNTSDEQKDHACPYEDSFDLSYAVKMLSCCLWMGVYTWKNY